MWTLQMRDWRTTENSQNGDGRRTSECQISNRLNPVVVKFPVSRSGIRVQKFSLSQSVT